MDVERALGALGLFILAPAVIIAVIAMAIAA